MSRTAQDLHHRRLHKCYDCATLVPVHHMYCDRCQGIQDALKAPTTPVEPSTNQERIMQ